MTNGTSAGRRLVGLFKAWKSSQHELASLTDELLERLTDQDGAGGEYTQADLERRLESFARQVKSRFATEEELGKLLAEVRSGSAIEVEQVQRLSQTDHEHLLVRLGELVAALLRAETDSQDWRKAVYDFGLFVDKLEQHEELEADQMSWLIPKKTASKESD